MKPRIAIFSGDDRTWALDAWAKTLPLLSDKAEIAGIWIFPEKLGRRSGAAVPQWYLKTFGAADFAKLSLFALRRKAASPGVIRSWSELAGKVGADIRRAQTPNAPEVAAWVREQKVDVVFITVNQILAGPILDAPRIGIINKHSALLPAARGVFPYLWSVVGGLPTGISLHQVNVEIDGGPVLCQMKHPVSGPPMSLLRFYADVHAVFPEMAVLALERLLKREFRRPPADLQNSYFGFPTAADVARFRKKGGRIADWEDISYRSALRFQENFS